MADTKKRAHVSLPDGGERPGSPQNAIHALGEPISPGSATETGHSRCLGSCEPDMGPSTAHSDQKHTWVTGGKSSENV
jgi:hypothetical protein